MKISPVGAEFFHAEEDRLTDGWTDRQMTELTVAFLQFCERA